MRRFEHRSEPLLPRRRFLGRLARYASASLAIVVASLGIGVAGYHWIAALPWMDALLNAAMILAGMGPVDALASDAAKLFASAYALFSGVAFLSTVAVLFAPIVHRMFHALHVDPDDENSAQGRRKRN